ncbi:hypothetical protein CR513_27621, partial [Mucuna pruriens]
MEKKTSSWSFKKLSKELWPRRLSSFRGKRLHIHTAIIDTVVFKIVSVVEGVNILTMPQMMK